MGLRAGLDKCGKSRSTGIRSLDHPARRQSLYRQRYPAHISCIFIASIAHKVEKVCNTHLRTFVILHSTCYILITLEGLVMTNRFETCYKSIMNM